MTTQGAGEAIGALAHAGDEATLADSSTKAAMLSVKAATASRCGKEGSVDDRDRRGALARVEIERGQKFLAAPTAALNAGRKFAVAEISLPAIRLGLMKLALTGSVAIETPGAEERGKVCGRGEIHRGDIYGVGEDWRE